MNKLLGKDVQRLKHARFFDQKIRILKSIKDNANFLSLSRWKASSKLNKMKHQQNSEHSVTNRCLKTISRKQFNYSSFFSRHLLLKFLRNGFVSGARKAVW